MSAPQPSSKALIQELRLPFLTVTLVPVLAGTCLAWAQNGYYQTAPFLLTLFMFGCFHLSANVLNDYFDHIQGTDQVNQTFLFPFTGGSRLIQQGLLTPTTVLVEGLVLLIMGLVLGIGLVWRSGPAIIGVGLFAALSAAFYTAPPFRWVHRGWGEMLIGLNFGPLMVWTAYGVQTHGLSWSTAWTALALACFSTAILYVNEFPDVQADRETGKHHWVVRWGTAKARIGYLLLMLGGNGALWFVASTHRFSLLTGLLVLPLALSGFGTLRLWKYHDRPQALVGACIATILTHLAAGIYLILAPFSP